MTCLICFHPTIYQPHICLVQTCVACFSPKLIHEMYCQECKTTPPCKFCQIPSKYEINKIKLCTSHLYKCCLFDYSCREARRAHHNQTYDTNCKKQQLKRLTKKLGRPRLAALSLLRGVLRK